MPSPLGHLWRNVVRRRQVERDLDEELRATHDLLVAEKLRAGLAPEEARRVAALELGGVEAVKERVRDVRAGAIVDMLRQDLRYALRLLRRNPVFALTAALSLAIGIGATTTIFTLANGLLLRVPGGVADSGRVVEIFHTSSLDRISQPVVPYHDYLEFRRRTTTLEGTYAYGLELTPVALRLPSSDGAERAFAGVVSVSYFNVLGVSAEVGRVFGSIDRDDVDASPVVVLSHRFWTRRFNADPTIVGRTVLLNSRPFTVVGVAREDFRGMSVVVADLWAPIGMVSAFSTGSRVEFLQVMIGGRLKPGVAEGQAAAETDAIGRAISGDHPLKEVFGRAIGSRAAPRGGGESFGLAAASPVPGTLRLAIGGFLALLMGLVSIVLVIACANIAGVLLARATARRSEIAVRLAIGASRGRLVRQLLTETLVLFAGGAIAGLALARGMTTLLLKLMPVFPLPMGVSLPRANGARRRLVARRDRLGDRIGRGRGGEPAPDDVVVRHAAARSDRVRWSRAALRRCRPDRVRGPRSTGGEDRSNRSAAVRIEATAFLGGTGTRVSKLASPNSNRCRPRRVLPRRASCLQSRQPEARDLRSTCRWT